MDEIQQGQRATYLRGLLEHYGTLSLPLGSGLSFASVQVFQPLRLCVRTVDARHQHAQQDKDELAESQEDGVEHDKHEHVEEVPETIAENGIEALALSPRGRLVMLGGPGSGKTTVLKHLLCHYARLALEQNDALLPIFLSLPDLARAGQDLADYLALVAHELGLSMNGGAPLFHAIQQGRAFVCLDSLDEVLPRLRPGIIRQINHLAEQPGNVWIVGSRFTDYKGGQFQREQFQEWELQTLDEARRLRLAAQLFSALPDLLSLTPLSLTHLDPREYVRSLVEHQQATSWGENPLLFSLGAVHILALDGVEKHIAPLLVALGHEEERVRWTANTMLKPVVNAIPLEDLVAMLQHPLPGTRCSTLHLLAEHQTHPEAESLPPDA